MNTVLQVQIKIISALFVAISLSTAPVLAGGFLDKLKDIEKTIDMVTKPPKVQADVGGVKLDLSSCSAKTGVKTIDKASKEKTEGKCDTKEKEDEPAEVVKVNDTGAVTDTDSSADR